MGSSESLPINQSAPPRAAHDQSLSTPGTASGHLSPPRPLSVYFTLPRYPPDSQHHHLPLDLSEIAKVTSIFTSLHLPVELVQRILEEAEYFMGCRRFQKKHVIVPSDSQQREAPMHWVNGQEKVLGEEIKMEGSGLSGGKGELWYLVSSPIGCDARPAEANHPLENWQWTEIHERGEADYEGLVRMGGQRRVWVRRIVLETLSRDQGWSSGNPAHYGTYEQSYSWFELSLLRDGREVPGSRQVVQYNVHNGQYHKAHSSTLEADHPLVRLARTGDRVVVWARAKYPGWVNDVREAAITVFTAPFPLDT